MLLCRLLLLFQPLWLQLEVLARSYNENAVKIGLEMRCAGVVVLRIPQEREARPLTPADVWGELTYFSHYTVVQLSLLVALTSRKLGFNDSSFCCTRLIKHLDFQTTLQVQRTCFMTRNIPERSVYLLRGSVYLSRQYVCKYNQLQTFCIISGGHGGLRPLVW